MQNVEWFLWLDCDSSDCVQFSCSNDFLFLFFFILLTNSRVGIRVFGGGIWPTNRDRRESVPNPRFAPPPFLWLEGGGRSRSARPPRADGRAPSTGVESCSPLFLLSLRFCLSLSFLSSTHLTHTLLAVLCSLIIVVVVFFSLLLTDIFSRGKRDAKSCGSRHPSARVVVERLRPEPPSTKTQFVLLCPFTLLSQPDQKVRATLISFSCVSSWVCDKKTCFWRRQI